MYPSVKENDALLSDSAHLDPQSEEPQMVV
jgi:hypothetical protein